MSENRTKINWFPGHMAKTMRLIAYEIRNVEAVAEIIDARIPFSSQNPNLRRACGRKPRIFILNKADLADEQLTREWIKLFTSKGYAAIALNGKKSSEKKKLVAALDSFVNIAKVENRPGVTRGKQWLSADRFELLDMPGVLWEKFSDMSSAYNLAYTGAIRDDVFDMEEVACSLLQELYTVSPQALKTRLELEEEEQSTGYELLELVAKQRGFLLRGGIPDTEKAAKAVLTDLRDGKFGRVTLEAPRW